jgi:hypothetical protein
MSNLASGVLASGLAVNGAHGVFILIAMILFIVAAIVAWVLAPRAVYATFVAAGLAIYMLALLWT